MKYKVSIAPEAHKANSRLRAAVHFGGKRLRINLGYNVDADDPEKWVDSIKRCAPKTKHGKNKVPAKIINRAIEDFEDAVEAYFIAHDSDTADMAELERLLTRRSKTDGETKEENSVTVGFEYFVRTASVESHWEPGTTTKQRTLLNDLKAFCTEKCGGHVGFESVTDEFLSRFSDYLVEKGNTNSTVKKKLVMMKWFLKWSVKKGRATSVPGIGYEDTLKETKRPVIFLDWDELMKLYHTEMPEKLPHLERARDMFCFQCFTGMRYSDIAKLRKMHVYDDTIHFTTQKTYDTIEVELNDYSRSILDKYKNIADEGEEPDPNGLALPVISLQKYNNYIKEACQHAKIDTPVLITRVCGTKRDEITKPKHEVMSSHAGRRTFICNALTLGIPVTTVMEWSGHSSYKSMKPYISASNAQRRNFMTLFNSVSNNEKADKNNKNCPK